MSSQENPAAERFHHLHREGLLVLRGAGPELCDGQLLSNNARRLLEMRARRAASD